MCTVADGVLFRRKQLEKQAHEIAKLIRCERLRSAPTGLILGRPEPLSMENFFQDTRGEVCANAKKPMNLLPAVPRAMRQQCGRGMNRHAVGLL